MFGYIGFWSMNMDLGVIDYMLVVEAMSMNEIIQKQSLLKGMNKWNIAILQYLNGKMRGNLPRKVRKGIQSIRDKPKKHCVWKLWKLSKKEEMGWSVVPNIEERWIKKKKRIEYFHWICECKVHWWFLWKQFK